MSAAPRAQTGQALRVVPLVHGDQVLVSFELTDGLTDEVRQAILSGLKTTFTYTVELRLDVPAWVDRTIGVATVASSVEYYNLEREHHLVRMLDGRTEDAKVTPDEAVVRKWMTSFDRLPLFRTMVLEPNREYYVRPPEQRFHPLALRQRNVRAGEVHVRSLGPSTRSRPVTFCRPATLCQRSLLFPR
jgi:hypothetical protein